jgi:hypothetical protein
LPHFDHHFFFLWYSLSVSPSPYPKWWGWPFVLGWPAEWEDIYAVYHLLSEKEGVNFSSKVKPCKVRPILLKKLSIIIILHIYSTKIYLIVYIIRLIWYYKS